MSRVITHTYTSGETLTTCARHNDSVGDYSPTGAAYSGVQHGAHEGTCEICAALARCEADYLARTRES